MKKIALTILLWLIFPSFVFAATISFSNPADPSGNITNITNFFKAVLGGILNIIAYLGVLFLVISGVTYIIGSSSGNDGLIGTAKKIAVGSIIGLALALAGPTFMKDIKEIVLNGGEMPTDIASAPSLSTIVSNVLSFLLSAIGILAIISLVINSIWYLTAGGNSAKTDKAKTNITWSIIGLAIAGAALMIVKQIAYFITGV